MIMVLVSMKTLQNYPCKCKSKNCVGIVLSQDGELKDGKVINHIDEENIFICPRNPWKTLGSCNEQKNL